MMLGVNLYAGACSPYRNSGPMPIYLMTLSQSNIVGVATGTVNRAPNAIIWNSPDFVDLRFNTSGSGCTNLGNSATTIGPECAFAEAAAAFHGRTVGIIKIATGTTSLDASGDWQATNTPTQGTKLAAALVQIAAALAWLDAEGIAYEVKGGVSMIGETEAGVSAIVANRHGFNYQNAIYKIREAVGNMNLPWAIGRPYDNGAGLAYMNNIRAAEAELVGNGDAEYYVKNLYLVDTDGFARTASNVHFTEAGYNSFGTALFNAVNVDVVEPAGFSPEQLYMLGGCYHAGYGVTYDGSNDVSRWNDQSVAQWDMGQSGAAAAKPNYDGTGYGGVPAVVFDGTNTVMSTGTLVGDTSAGGRQIQPGADNKFSMAFVWYINNPSANGILMGKFGGSSGGKTNYAMITSARKAADLAYMNAGGTAYRGQQSDAALTNATRYSLIFSYDGSVDSNDGDDRFKIYVNGSPVSHSDFINAGTLADIQTTAFAPLALGAACMTGETSAASNAKGSMQFALLCGEAMTDARAAELHAWMATEFGL